MAFRYNSLSKDVPSIGLMRGIASVMVCYYHLAHENPLLPQGNVFREIGTWGWTGVEVFFIISGFVIPYSMFVNNYTISKVWVFMKKRIVRIEPPYLISIVLVILLNYVSTLLPTYKGLAFIVDWKNVATHIAYLNIFTGQKWLQDVYWTLAVEFQFYLVIAISFSMVVSAKLYQRSAFYTVFISFMFLKISGNNFIFPFTGFFMLGILLFQYYCRIINDYEFWILMLIDLGSLLYFQNGILTMIAAVTVCMIAGIKKVPAIFKFLGMISFSLYLIHIPIGGRINNLAADFITNIHLREATVFISIGTCIVASWIFYVFVEKKFKKISASISYKTSLQSSIIHDKITC